MHILSDASRIRTGMQAHIEHARLLLRVQQQPHGAPCVAVVRAGGHLTTKYGVDLFNIYMRLWRATRTLLYYALHRETPEVQSISIRI
jgi:hypothetical protein